MTEAPRHDEHDDQPVVTPLRPLTALSALPGLQTLDLGVEDAIGMVCDIDDPDCVPGVPSGISLTASRLADRGVEDDA